jgi:hypothetical protein
LGSSSCDGFIASKPAITVISSGHEMGRKAQFL